MIPYQFAYVVACIVQLITCVYASRLSRDMVSDPSDSSALGVGQFLIATYSGLLHRKTFTIMPTRF